MFPLQDRPCNGLQELESCYKAVARNIYAQMPTEYITLVNHYAQIPKDILLEELHVFMTQVLPELDTPYETDKAA